LQAIAVDATGNAYITGATTSTDFPLVPATAIQTTNNAIGSQIGTAFLSRINPASVGLGSLVYSTFLGGSKEDSGLGVAANSSNTPNQKAIVSRIDTTKSGASSLVYSRYFGGTVLTLGGAAPGVDLGFGIAVAPAGTIYLAGTSRSADFPATPGAPQTSIVGT